MGERKEQESRTLQQTHGGRIFHDQSRSIPRHGQTFLVSNLVAKKTPEK